jgi:SAM-dependent methyltransferase
MTDSVPPVEQSERRLLSVTDALGRAQNLLDPSRCRRVDLAPAGYLDTLDAPSTPPLRGLGPRLMHSPMYSAAYQKLRPLGMRLLSGLEAPGRTGDHARTASRLGLHPGSTVIDIACGPGNFTKPFAEIIGPAGLAVGVDASPAMLKRGVADNSGPNISYVRGDAENLPFSDAVADAVSCLAALYLVNDPRRVIEEMGRILVPGGRLVILTSLQPGSHSPLPALGRLAGVRFFDRTEVVNHVLDAGFTDIQHITAGISQTVIATKASA